MIALFIYFFAICLIVGFFSIINWLAGLLKLDEPPAAPPIPPKAVATGERSALNMQAVRARITDLYMQGRLSLEAMNEVLAILKLAPEKETSSETPGVGPLQESAPISPATSSMGSSVRRGAAIPPPPLPPPAPASGSPSGLYDSSNVKTLLISGAALFVLSAYLFVRSYWQFISGPLKFAILVAMTAGLYALGRFLRRDERTPRTSETLLSLAIALIPFNAAAADLLVFHQAVGFASAWSIGFLLMTFAAAGQAISMPVYSMGLLIGAGIEGAAYFATAALRVGPQLQCMHLAWMSLLLMSAACLIEMKETLRKSLVFVADAAAVLIAIWLVFHGLFLDQPDHRAAAVALALLGALFAVQARFFEAEFAYLAGLLFGGALATLLHAFHVPIYKYGLFFVPGGALCTLRAWTFKRSGREQLAAPYFQLGQLAMACSLLAILPSFEYYAHQAFSTLLIVYFLAIASYALLGAIYEQPAFSLAIGVTTLMAAGSFVVHRDLSFPFGTLVFAGLGWVFIAAAVGSGEKREAQIALPFYGLGLGTLTFALFLLAGKWASEFTLTGVLRSGFPSDQLDACIAVGVLCAAAYAFLAWVKRQPALVYAVLASLSIVYVFVLERFGLSFSVLRASFAIAGLLSIFYATHYRGFKQLAQCFGVWSELMFVVVWIGSIRSGDHELLPMIIATAAFLPSLFVEYEDMTIFTLLGIYITHWVWHAQLGVWHMGEYAFELMIVNCAVVMLRSCMTFLRPTLTIWPYRLISISASVVSMALSLSDPDMAWQVFAAHGLMAVVVSLVHYEGRYLYVGTTLLLASYELFLRFAGVQLTELYSVPAGLYMIAGGALAKDGHDRNMLFFFGQLVLFIPSFRESLAETWGGHSIFLGVACVAVMMFGMNRRNKCLTTVSLGMLLMNGGFQARDFFRSVPRWLYLGTGGITLVGLGGLFEFQRETMVRMGRDWAEQLEQWE